MTRFTRFSLSDTARSSTAVLGIAVFVLSGPARAQTPEEVPQEGVPELPAAVSSDDPEVGPDAEPEPGPEDAEARSNRLAAEGAAAFEAGELESAIELLTQANEIHPKPNLVFNIGRVYEELGELEQAERYYSEFLTLPGVELETRGYAAERIEVIRKVLGARTKAREQEEARARSTEIEANAAEKVATPEETAVPIAPEPRTRAVPKLRIAGAVTLGVGGAALITGAILGGLASSRTSQADEELLIADQNRLLRGARSLAVATDGLLIAGGIVAVAGATMLGVSYSKRFKQRAALVPSVGRHHVSLGYTQRF